MEVIPNIIPTYLPENGNVSDRSVCFQILQSNSKMFYLETRPTQFSYGGNATRMEPGNSICISPVFVNSESTLQNRKGESQHSNTDNSSTANLTLVSKSSCNVIFSIFSTSNVSRSSEEPERRRPTLSNKQIFSASGLEGYRKTLFKSSISERAAHFIVNMSINGYRSAISSFHEKIENLPSGQHHEICTLLTRVFNLRSP